MRLTVNTFTTLDGVMQGPGAADEDRTGGFRHGGWLVPLADERMGEVVEGWFEQADAVLLGATTYRMMASHWPLLDDDGSHTWRVLNTAPKHVVSSTLRDEDASWQGTVVVRGDVVAAVRRLKEVPGRELQVHGSWRLVQSLHEAGLVDAYRLLVFPVVVGGGKRLFADGAPPRGFEVDEVSATTTGARAMTLLPRQFRQGGLAIEDGVEIPTGS